MAVARVAHVKGCAGGLTGRLKTHSKVIEEAPFCMFSSQADFTMMRTALMLTHLPLMYLSQLGGKRLVFLEKCWDLGDTLQIL